MSLKSVENIILESGRYSASSVPNTIDAAGESVAFIGQIYIEGGASSKTFSSSGGMIAFRTGSVTFANSGTNVRIGIQDLTSGGVNDDVFDVYADFTGGGGGLASNTFYEKSMTSGSKTINNYDIVAITFEMTAKGGSDSVQINAYYPQSSIFGANIMFPYRAIDTGSGPAKQSSFPSGAILTFDDGTLGWIQGSIFHIEPFTGTSNFNINSTPDEYAAVFKLPFKCSAIGGYFNIGSIGSTDDFDIILYSDAEGTPVAGRTASINPNYVSTTSTIYPYFFSFSSFTIEPNKWYAIGVRPTTANSIQVSYYNYTSTFGNKYKKMSPFGTNCKFSSRTNQSGAFSEVASYYQPLFGLSIDKLDDGIGGCYVSV